MTRFNDDMFGNHDHDFDFDFDDGFHKKWNTIQREQEEIFKKHQESVTMGITIFIYILAAVVVLAILIGCCCSKKRRGGQIISPPPPPPGPNQPVPYPQQQYAAYPTQAGPHPVPVVSSYPVQSAAPYPTGAPYPTVTPYPTATQYPHPVPYPTATPYPPQSAPSAPDAYALYGAAPPLAAFAPLMQASVPPPAGFKQAVYGVGPPHAAFAPLMQPAVPPPAGFKQASPPSYDQVVGQHGPANTSHHEKQPPFNPNAPH